MHRLEGSPLRKYFRIGEELRIASHPHEQEVPSPALFITGGPVPTAPGFRLATFAITQPFEMVHETHTHDFDQYLCFFGGDMRNMLDLGGEVEFCLAEGDEELQTFVFAKPFAVYIPAGMRHCPLRYTRVDDPARPLIHQDLVFTGEYIRKPAPEQGSSA